MSSAFASLNISILPSLQQQQLAIAITTTQQQHPQQIEMDVIDFEK